MEPPVHEWEDNRINEDLQQSQDNPFVEGFPFRAFMEDHGDHDYSLHISTSFAME